MLTGDQRATAEHLAEDVGITTVLADVLPDEKDTVQSLREQGRTVAMVGDGINDAAALASAHLGIAMGGGAGIAVDAAQLVLLRDDLMDVRGALDLGRHTVGRFAPTSRGPSATTSWASPWRWGCCIPGRVGCFRLRLRPRR